VHLLTPLESRRDWSINARCLAADSALKAVLFRGRLAPKPRFLELTLSSFAIRSGIRAGKVPAEEFYDLS